MSIGSKLRSIYLSKEPLSDKDYETSRTFFIFEGATARTIMALTTGAFLAGFLSFLGAGDSFNGLVAAIPVFSSVIQLMAPLVYERLEKRKHIVAFLCLIHRLLLGLLVFIPFFVKGETVRLWVIAAILLVSYMAGSFVNPAASGWIIDLVPVSIRGRYFGVRESYLVGATTVFTLIMGRVLDLFKDAGNEYGGFIVMFSLVLVLAVCNSVFISLIKEPSAKKSKSELTLRKIVTIPLKDRKFRKIILLFILWNLGVQMAIPFFAVYMVTGLKLNYTLIMVMGMLGTLVNTLVVRFWGKLADKKSWVHVIKLSILILSVTHLVWFFINPQTVYMFIFIVHISGGIAWAGINISAFNIQFTYSPEEGRTVYIGFNAALSGLVGFLSALVGSGLVLLLASLKLNFLGFTIGGMQVIFAVSGVLLAVCAAYIHLFIKPESE